MTKILIVDDDVFIRKIIRRELEGGGYEVEEAADGFQAIQSALTVPYPDLITLDIGMPEMDGYETFSQLHRRLRQEAPADSNNITISVIFVTANDTLDDRRIGFELGAADFIAKPFKKGQLLATVNKILKPQERLKGLTALVVDDNQVSRNLLSGILRREGLAILTARDGLEAYQILRSRKFAINIVITDLSMPRMEGDLLCRKIRYELDLKHLPVIILTGNEEQDKLLELFEAGATDYLHKPFAQEELLARLNVHLELEQALSDLKKAQKASEIADQAKNEFLNNISHEIRTPLNAITGFLDLLCKTPLTSQQLDYLAQVKSASRALLTIISDILDFAKLESGTIHISANDFNLEDLLEEIAPTTNMPAAKKEIAFLLDIDHKVPLLLTGDSIRLRQVLFNLVNNAVKFTNQGEIVVSVEVQPDTAVLNNEVKLKFMVQDTGIGLSSDHKKLLFQAFHQADGSITRKYGGSGLGLAICRRLINLMGGTIEVDSELGRGSTFSFSVVLGMQKNAHEVMPLISEAALKKRTLIIDRNSTAQRILSKMLAPLGVPIQPALSVDQAIADVETALADNTPFELVLLDYGLKGKDSDRVLHHLSSLSGAIPLRSILMIPRWDDQHCPTPNPCLGIADACLPKPFTRSALLGAIATLFPPPDSLNAWPPWSLNGLKTALFNIKGAHILIVEDHTINQLIMTELLEVKNLTVTTANNGREAVEAVCTPPDDKPFDAVLMDLEMPLMNGYEACQTLRDQGKFADLPIIALSAHPREQMGNRWQSCGMNDYLAKPIDPEQLYRTLVKWVRPPLASCASSQKPLAYITRQMGLPDQLPEIDIEAGLRSVGGNVPLFIKLLKEFHEDFGGIAVKVKSALNCNDIQTARRLVHTIKGVSGNIGATGLYKASKQLESIWKTKKNGDFTQPFADFENILKVVIQSTGVAIGPPNPTDLTAIHTQRVEADLSIAEPAIKKLRSLLNEGDSEAEEYVKHLIKQLNDSQFQEQVRILRDHIHRYQYKDALKILMHIADALGVE